METMTKRAIEAALSGELTHFLQSCDNLSQKRAGRLKIATKVSAPLTVLLDIGHAFRVLDFRMLEHAGLKRPEGRLSVNIEAGMKDPADGRGPARHAVCGKSVDGGFLPPGLRGVFQCSETVAPRSYSPDAVDEGLV